MIVTFDTLSDSVDFAKQALVFLIPFATAFILFFTLMESRAQKDLIRKQQSYSELPLLRLQWADKDINETFLVLRKSKSEKFHSYTDLRLINVGNGMARDVKISPFKIGGEQYRLMNLNVLANGHLAQLRYRVGFSHKGALDEESYEQKFVVPIKYKDVEGSRWSVKFVLDVDYNDGFKVIGPKRLDVVA